MQGTLLWPHVSARVRQTQRRCMLLPGIYITVFTAICFRQVRKGTEADGDSDKPKKKKKKKKASQGALSFEEEEAITHSLCPGKLHKILL